MRIGVLKEIKADEYRVALTPDGVAFLVERGHEVFVENRCGAGEDAPDEAYRAAVAVVCGYG